VVAKRSELIEESFGFLDVLHPWSTLDMKRHLAWFLILLGQLSFAALARAGVVTFEDFGLPPDSYDNNAGPGGFFNIDGNSFNNSYDPAFGDWSGWAISNTTYTPPLSEPDYDYQYSVIPNAGADGSATFAIAYTFGATANPFHPAGSWINLPAGSNPISVDVTNTTYAYLSMADGDSFTTPFSTANNDFFELDIAGYSGANGTGTEIGDVTFFLADFQDGNSYIVDTWQTINLLPLAGSASLVFGLQSSQNDPVFGMNTPAYVAIDNLVESGAAAVPEPGMLVIALQGLAAAFACRWKFGQQEGRFMCLRARATPRE
jgi:hypothetical protein